MSEAILRHLAPCGLNCGKCLAFEEGDIHQLALGLRSRLGRNFGAYAERFKRTNTAFENYPQFKELLDFLAEGGCGGCRKGTCLLQECRVRFCVEKKKVDFCFQCKEFPCEAHGLPPRLEALWRRNNEAMCEMGVEAFYNSIKDKPRYP